MRLNTIALCSTLALLLAGCGTSQPGSVLGGECRIAHTPEFAIAGKTVHDQAWIDDTIESYVGACGQARPKPRPAEWDVPISKPATKPEPQKKKPLISLKPFW